LGTVDRLCGADNPRQLSQVVALAEWFSADIEDFIRWALFSCQHDGLCHIVHVNVRLKVLAVTADR
jgi:hypothetical protein